MCPSDAPTRQDLDRLLDKIGPEIERILRHWQIDEAEAERLVQEALVGLAHRWGRIRRREQWLLQAIEKEARNRSSQSRQETEDG